MVNHWLRIAWSTIGVDDIPYSSDLPKSQAPVSLTAIRCSVQKDNLSRNIHVVPLSEIRAHGNLRQSGSTHDSDFPISLRGINDVLNMLSGPR